MVQQLKFQPKDLDPHAVGIVKALQKNGHTTYLVGGCVRDLIVGLKPKDFDIGTTAPPEVVRRIIYKSYVIGKRFRLVLVKRDEQQYEVATFRREISEDELKRRTEDALEAPRGDNFFGTPEEDARRRDFTINALFYDPVEHQLIDYCEGIKDLDKRVIRMIGPPDIRLREDPIRILRCVRLAHKLGFSIEPELRQAILKNADSLSASVLPRRREEILKILKLSDPSLAFLDLYDLGILKILLPGLVPVFEDRDRQHRFLHYLRHLHDRPIDSQQPVELFCVFLLAVLSDTDLSRSALDRPEMVSLLRDELGMFKYEQSLFAKSIQIQSLMKKKKDFEKRGPRRRQAVVLTEAFQMALQLAEREYLLTAEELNFWRAESELAQKTQPQTSFQRPDLAARRRRRRRPRSPS